LALHFSGLESQSYSLSRQYEIKDNNRQDLFNVRVMILAINITPPKPKAKGGGILTAQMIIILLPI
jgi:hypothetical protein